jgi:hypothetical protein
MGIDKGSPQATEAGLAVHLGVRHKIVKSTILARRAHSGLTDIKTVCNIR